MTQLLKTPHNHKLKYLLVAFLSCFVAFQAKAQERSLFVYNLDNPKNVDLNKFYLLLTDSTAGSKPQNLYTQNTASTALTVAELKSKIQFTPYIPYLVFEKYKIADEWQTKYVYAYYLEQTSHINKESEYEYRDTEHIHAFELAEAAEVLQKRPQAIWESNSMSVGEALRLDSESQASIARFIFKNLELGRLKATKNAQTLTLTSLKPYSDSNREIYIKPQEVKNEKGFFEIESLALYQKLSEESSILVGEINYNDFMALAQGVFLCQEKVVKNISEMLKNDNFVTCFDISLPAHNIDKVTVLHLNRSFEQLSNAFCWDINLELQANQFMTRKNGLIKQLMKATQKKRIKAYLKPREISMAELTSRLRKDTAPILEEGQENTKINPKDYFSPSQMTVLELDGQMIYNQSGQMKQYSFETLTFAIPSHLYASDRGIDYIIVSYNYNDVMKLLGHKKRKTPQGKKTYREVFENLHFEEERWLCRPLEAARN